MHLIVQPSFGGRTKLIHTEVFITVPRENKVFINSIKDEEKKAMKSKKSLATFVRGILVMAGLLTLIVGFAAFHATPASAHYGKAYVRVVHASPAAGPVDVYVDGAKLLKDFTFGSVTGYVAVPAGYHRIQVTQYKASRKDAVIDVTVHLSTGVYYTAAALGTKASGFSLAAFVDDNSKCSNKARVRVYHLSPNAGPVDVSVGGTKVISNLTYTHASGYLSVKPGTYVFDVTAVNAGVTIPLKVDLKADLVYSVFAIGLYKGQPPLQFVATAV